MEYSEFDVKGFRYCDAQMGSWMPETSKKYYLGKEEEEVLPEDGWREKVADSGLTLLSPRKWYLREIAGATPKLSLDEAEKLCLETFKVANTVTSSTSSDVWDAAVKRRL